jgi:hypothetical protein
MKIRLIITIALLISSVHTYSQYIWRDTLYKKYSVANKGLGKYIQSDINEQTNQDTRSIFYHTEDSIISNSFFFCVGLCLSNKEDPYYFIRISTLPYAANTLYFEKSPLKISINFIKGYDFANSKKIVFYSPGKMDGWHSTRFGGLDWESNCNIFKIKVSEIVYFIDYTIGTYELSSEDGTLKSTGGLIKLKPLFEALKNSITFSLL